MVLPPLDPDVIFADSPDIPSDEDNGSYHCSDSENCEWLGCCDGNHSYSQSYLDFWEEEEASSNYKRDMAKATLTSEEEEVAPDLNTKSDEGRCLDLEDEGEVAPDSYEGEEGEGEEEPDVDMHVTKPGQEDPDSYLDEDDLWVDEVDLDLL